MRSRSGVICGGPSSLDDPSERSALQTPLHDIPHEEQTALILLQIDSAYECGLWATIFFLLPFPFSFSYFPFILYTLGSCPMLPVSGIAKVMGLCMLCSPDDIYDIYD